MLPCAGWRSEQALVQQAMHLRHDCILCYLGPRQLAGMRRLCLCIGLIGGLLGVAQRGCGWLQPGSCKRRAFSASGLARHRGMCAGHGAVSKRWSSRAMYFRPAVLAAALGSILARWHLTWCLASHCPTSGCSALSGSDTQCSVLSHSDHKSLHTMNIWHGEYCVMPCKILQVGSCHQ